MADKDYSATPLWKKLGFKERARVAIVDPPDGFAMTYPGGVRLSTGRPLKPTDVILLFATRGAALRRTFRSVRPKLEPSGGLWVAYPKKSSGVSTDLTFQSVQKVGLDAGLVDNKSCSIDANWSAVRFVYRLKDRPT